MTETGFFKSGDNKLSYVCVIPQPQNRNVGIVFVHAAGGNRLGPHRMFVELARKLTSQRYPTLRFDLSGCGDSTGTASQNDIRPDVADVLAAIDFFITKVHLETVTLLGISKGALVCFSAMAMHNLPLCSAILLSTPISTDRAAIRSFSARLREYIYKLTDTKSLWKLLSGKADVSQITKTLIAALGLGRRYEQIGTGQFASKCPVLFIYGENDPIAAQSCRYYTNKCRENGLPYECQIIKGANHSFFHYKWKEQIFDISEKWLEGILGRVLV
jgi:pimeloyl-ACP methyl ester carboxylesterase